MMKQTFVYRILAMALAASAMASCVAEEFVECPPDVRLLIQTDQEWGEARGIYDTRGTSRGTDNIDEWYNCIDSVDVYVFDENLKFVALWEGGPYTPYRDYEVPLREIGLYEGLYTFVAWTNSGAGDDVGDDYFSNLEELMEALEPGVPGEEVETDPRIPGEREFLISDMRMNVSADILGANDEITKELPHRHYGIQSAYVSNNSILSPGLNTIVIAPSLRKVTFTVSGLAPEVVGDGYTMSVTDTNLTRDFYNHYVLGRKYRYIRPLELVGEPESPDGDTPQLRTSMHLMQLNDRTVTNFELHNASTGHLIRNGNLTDLIRTVYIANDQEVDFDATLEFNVNLSFISRTEIEVVINGWKYIWRPTIIGWK